MKILKWLDDYLEQSLGIILILAIAVILSIQVFMRYVMQDSLSWSEELARYMFVWLVYLGISYGAKIMRHIKIDAGLYMFPAAWRKYIVMFGDFIFLIFCLVVVVYAIKLSQRQAKIGQVSPAIGMSMVYLYMAPAVGFGLTAIRQVQTLIFRWRTLHETPRTPEIADLGL